MKKAYFLLFCFVLIFACTEQKVDLEASKEKLMEMDREFAAMSLEQGQVKAFLHYMADNAVIYPQKGFPVEGRKMFEEITKSAPSSGGTLEWEPSYADVAASGDIGYTLGKYKLTTPGEQGEDIKYGFYCTIWKKQSDGSWMFVFDGGNESPPVTPDREV